MTIRDYAQISSSLRRSKRRKKEQRAAVHTNDEGRAVNAAAKEMATMTHPRN